MPVSQVKTPVEFNLQGRLTNHQRQKSFFVVEGSHINSLQALSTIMLKENTCGYMATTTTKSCQRLYAFDVSVRSRIKSIGKDLRTEEGEERTK